MTIRDEEYFKQRLIALEEAGQKVNEEYIDDILQSFEEAKSDIAKAVQYYIGIIAVNESVSLAEARVLLDNSQLKEFKYDLKKFREVAIKAEADKSWVKKLDNASAKVRISRLEALEMNIEQSIQVVKAKQLRTTTDCLADIVKSQHYGTLYELQKGIGLEFGFKHIDDEQIFKLLKTPWAPDGTNFSARIWTDRTKLVAKLKQDLTQSLIQGQNFQPLVKSYQEQLGVNAYNATRLLRTESTFFANATRLDSYSEGIIKKYKYVAILDNRTSEICETLNNQVFNVSEAQAGVNYPAMHVNCRSTTIPVIDFDEDVYANMFDDELAEFDDELSILDWAKENGVDLDAPELDIPEGVFPKRVIQE